MFSSANAVLLEGGQIFSYQFMFVDFECCGMLHVLSLSGLIDTITWRITTVFTHPRFLLPAPDV